MSTVTRETAPLRIGSRKASAQTSAGGQCGRDAFAATRSIARLMSMPITVRPGRWSPASEVPLPVHRSSTRCADSGTRCAIASRSSSGSASSAAP